MQKQYIVEYYEKTGPQAIYKKSSKIHASTYDEARKIVEDRGFRVYRVYI